MLRRRLLYAAALLGALLFQIFNTTYLAHFLLALTLCLPVLSLLLSLPAMVGCRLRVEGADCVRGAAAVWRVQITVPAGLPLARLTLRLTQTNHLTGARQSRRVALTGVRCRQVVTLPADTRHCGRLGGVAGHLRVCDSLGLFALPKRAVSGSFLVLPAPIAPEPLAEACAAAPAAPTPGQATGRAGEDYELRPYRPGDPLRQVHWKVSAKLDDLVVRERLEDPTPTVLLGFDRFGAPRALDRTFDRLDALCRALLEAGRAVHVLWTDPDGTLHDVPVSSLPQWRAGLAEALSTAAPPTGITPRTPPLPAGVRGPLVHHHIAMEEEDAACPSASTPPSARR